MDGSRLLENLNAEQLEAVTSTEGFVRVIAGAGSGKTRALTNRYAYLVEELGISSSNILCLTFTNKAAREMKRRVRTLLGDGIDTSFVATLHSYCTRILREDIGRLFYPENFIVLDNSDQKKILEEIYDELGIKMDTASFQFMIDKIKFEKNLLYYLDYITAPDKDIRELEPKTMELKVIYRYIEKQKKYFALDFFDLINFVFYLFNNHPAELEKWQNRMHYVMVDEFQDITVKEFKLIRRLTDINKNWFVVGDPDQNIYEWRGSRMSVLMDFADNMQPCKTIMMSENYRSAPEILAAANSLISKNKNRIEKELYTKKEKSILPEHFHGKNDNEEIKYITGKIKEHIQGGGKYTDIAVIYRSNHVSRFVEQGFLKENIPYTVYGGTGFYERAEIKDVLSYLRLVAYGDDLSFLRIINTPRRKMGKTKVSLLRELATTDNTTLYETLVNHINNPGFKGTGAADFVNTITRIRELSETLQVSELVQRLLIEAKYELYIRESGDMDRLDNVSELIRAIVLTEADYGEKLTLATFLQDVSLNSELEEDELKEQVKIMTAHTAKGLEFNIVFVVSMTDGVFPSIRALEERREAALEEERRLAFVALTRARKRLYLSESEGQGFRGYSRVPSRFLFDIDEGLITRIGSISEAIMEEFRFQTRTKTVEREASYPVGAQVKHKVFGEGIVEAIDDNTKTYIIRFMHGTKPISFGYKGLSQVF